MCVTNKKPRLTNGLDGAFERIMQMCEPKNTVSTTIYGTVSTLLFLFLFVLGTEAALVRNNFPGVFVGNGAWI